MAGPLVIESGLFSCFPPTGGLFYFPVRKRIHPPLCPDAPDSIQQISDIKACPPPYVGDEKSYCPFCLKKRYWRT
ncbi:hypothetical protein BSM4216_3651 [Bacillus smithii]|nr:hypothetical protein BSM4216_3651 [Bacillus smithii]